jgi:quercetin dioxygenase-like cupin family protein
VGHGLPLEALFVEPGAGQPVVLGGTIVTLRIAGTDTDGTYAAMELALAPGAGSARHVHQNEDETFAVLEGAITFQLGARTVETPAGGLVFIPRGLWHAFVNTDPAPAKALIIVTPAGLERYFAELDALLKAVAPDAPANDDISVLNQKYGLIFSTE